jgi:Domain of unknown function (DUF4145)
MLNRGDQLKLDRCPHCGIASPLFGKLWLNNTTSFDGRRTRTWVVYGCSTCGGVVLCGGDPNRLEVTEQYPRGEKIDDPAIPERSRNYLGQAINSLHAPAGAVILAASCVDAMLKTKGYKEGSLNSRIEQAVKNHLITEAMGKWAHAVRLDANEQRHADEAAPLPTVDDARRVIEFAKALAVFLFVLPAMVDKGINDATQKTGNKTSPSKSG